MMNVGKGLSWPLGTPAEFVAYWEDIRRQLYATEEQRDKALDSVERLTRERDEARAEVRSVLSALNSLASVELERDEARAELAAARQTWSVELEAAQHQRDEARAELRRARSEASLLTVACDGLRALLREVEWGDWGRPYHGEKVCPMCYRRKALGHAPDCRLAAALEGHDG